MLKKVISVFVIMSVFSVIYSDDSEVQKPVLESQSEVKETKAKSLELDSHIFYIRCVAYMYSPQLGSSAEISLLNYKTSFDHNSCELSFDLGGEIGNFYKGYIGINLLYSFGEGFSKGLRGGSVSLRGAYWGGLNDIENLEKGERYYGLESIVSYRAIIFNVYFKAGYLISEGRVNEREDPFFAFSFGVGIGF